MPLLCVRPPVCEPLAVADVRQHVRQDITDDDNLIAIALSSARQFAEMETRRQFVSARYELVLDGFPGSGLIGIPWGKPFGIPEFAIQLPKSPLIQVVSIQYTAMDGDSQTFDPSLYTVNASCNPPVITPIFGQIWPIPLPQIGSVRVTFDAGYIAPVTFNQGASTVSVQGWPTLAAGANIRLSNTGGALPAGLSPKTDYYVKTVVSPGVYTLSTSVGGALISLTGIDSGQSFLGQPGINESPGELPEGLKSWMLLRCDSLYSYRGETAMSSRGEIAPLPWVDRLLDPFRVLRA